jgi:hypothetical protein
MLPGCWCELEIERQVLEVLSVGYRWTDIEVVAVHRVAVGACLLRAGQGHLIEFRDQGSFVARQARWEWLLTGANHNQFDGHRHRTAFDQIRALLNRDAFKLDGNSRLDGDIVEEMFRGPWVILLLESGSRDCRPPRRREGRRRWVGRR